MDYSLPLSMGFSRQEYWSGLLCPPPGDLPNPGIEHMLAGGFFTTSTTWEAPTKVKKAQIIASWNYQNKGTEEIARVSLNDKLLLLPRYLGCLLQQIRRVTIFPCFSATPHTHKTTQLLSRSMEASSHLLECVSLSMHMAHLTFYLPCPDCQPSPLIYPDHLLYFHHMAYHYLAGYWRRQWQPTPVLLPGKSRGRRGLVGCCPWGHTELDTTEAT